MKVAVVTNQVPFIRGGAEMLAETLRDKLREFGHDSELIRLPFAWNPLERVPEHMLAARLTRVGNTDRIIGLKFPAYFVPHESKVIWLLHQFRQAYDLHGSDFQEIPDSPEGTAIRTLVKQWDDRYLGEAERIYTISEVATERLRRFNGLDSTVLLHPLRSTEGLRCEEYGDFVVALGRISAGKRQHLLVEAMRHVSSDVRLVVAGPPESPAAVAVLEGALSDRRVAARVDLIPRWISEEEKQNLLSRALATAYVPYDEDSYGYVTLESFYAAKPVVTCTDAGGVLSIVREQQTGLVVPPRPEEIAAAFDKLRDDHALAERLGGRARTMADELGITWERTVEVLTR
jgi:glycosyltransferase involved in cell wall biosynthesis